jgi:hypothetical protein
MLRIGRVLMSIVRVRRRPMPMRLSPLLEDVGRVAVHVEPRQRVGKCRAMGQTSDGTWRRLRRDEPRSEVDNLTQTLDVTPGDG